MQHTSALATKRRDKLRALLNDRGISCTAHWREVKAILAEEPTAPVYNSASQVRNLRFVRATNRCDLSARLGARLFLAAIFVFHKCRSGLSVRSVAKYV